MADLAPRHQPAADAPPGPNANGPDLNDPNANGGDGTDPSANGAETSRPATTASDSGFLGRHLGPRPAERDAMLATLGCDSLEDLVARAVPEHLRDADPLDLPAACSEHEALARLAELAEANTVRTPLLGQGFHGTITPSVIRRGVLEDPGWYTAYTPYQPEISQGRLEALLLFQTMVADLTGLPIANASLLDEASAAAEAMTLARRRSRVDGDVFAVDADCHPQTLAVLRTRAEPIGVEIRVGEPAEAAGQAFGALLSYPGSSGQVRDWRATIATLRGHGAVVGVAADPLALTLLTPPGELGADLAIGSTQRFGVPLWYGGPHAAYLAVAEGLERALPGRMVGVSVDAAGRRAYRLALQAREQHIRRDRATSNICTAQVLLAVVAAMYAVYHGPEGLRAIAEGVHDHASAFASAAAAAGVEVATTVWFDTVTVRLPGRAEAVREAAVARGLLVRTPDADRVTVAFDETTTPEVVASALAALSEVTGTAATPPTPPPGAGLPAALTRTSAYLTHPTFHEHRSETALRRYLRRLRDADLALDRAMIPLGSCTMKLNPTTALEPISWRGFADLHPYAPRGDAAGYERLIGDLEAWLAEITGYDAVSLQPNAGSQGELSGLLAIRRYLEASGEGHRDVCLVPASAHGTNAASAALAGLRVVLVDCDERGDVSLAHLRERLAEHGDRLAAIMLTYPSTHGVFEPGVVEVCDLVHAAGGQVYLDGANLNALVGIARPGRLGADVSHLNLHKTFAIPHGGGGPGVGPIGVRGHLAPFLPATTADAGEHARGLGPVAAAPWGSAGILPVSWAYLAMTGPDGLRTATQTAILAANYVAARLEPAYPVLYRGRGGFVAHECILDLRPITEACGVTAEDVAKRLVDHGFHAPTMAFPVPGTLMVEPTESESKAELDRFCDALLAIREEIRDVADGRIGLADSPLRHAPHPAADLLTEPWDRPYARATAAHPAGVDPADKYWPPVSRIDNAYGDRNLVCSCPLPSEVAEG